MNDRRQTFRPGDPGRRLMDRIKALDPTILECGPECMGHGACGATYPGMWQPTTCTLRSGHDGQHADEKRSLVWSATHQNRSILEP